jgi:hypothetical protein
MFHPTWPTEAAFDCLATQLGALRSGELRDQVSIAISCLDLPPDEAREVVAGIWWDKCHLSTCLPCHQSAEVQQRRKHGSWTLRDPFSALPLKGRSLLRKFMRFFEPHCTQINPRSAVYADTQLMRWIRKASLRSTSALDAALSFDSGKKARGWPWFVSTSTVPLCYLNEAEALLADGLRLEHASAYPGVGQTRGQAQGSGLAASWRGIIGTSMVPNILKKMLYVPLRNALIGTTKFCAWRNRAAVDRAVSSMLKSSTGGLILSVDFSNFDSSIPDEVLRRMFKILRHWFHGSDVQLVRWCEESFLRTGLYLPEVPGEYLSGSLRKGGVPSGSVLTNLIDSMVNYWAVTYAAHRLGVRVEECLLQGDDGVYRFEGQVNFETLSEILLVELGLTMSPSKCLISDREVSYLQSTHSIDWQVEGTCVGVRPIMRFLNGYMRRFPLEDDAEWGEVLGAVRTLQQLDNCSGHPCFEQAWRLAWEHDFENLFDAIQRLCNNDRRLLHQADEVRTLRAGGISTTVGELYRSPTVSAIRASFPKVFST